MNSKRAWFSFVGTTFLTAFSITSFGQKSHPTPVHKDVFYGQEDREAQLLDVYRANDQTLPAVIYFHGGGWRAGSKKRIPAFLQIGLRQELFHVVSVEYRFTDVAPHPAQTDDCMRAIQFVRHHAGQWKIDPEKLAVTGGSAGAHLALWVALHDDRAIEDSDDPVKRQSTIVSCAAAFAGPTDWGLLSEIEHQHPAYRQLLGYEPGTPAGEMDAEKKRDVSPISHVSKDDPPILLFHGEADVIVPFQHAKVLEKKLKEAGVTCELLSLPEGRHSVAGAGEAILIESALAGLKKYFLEKGK